VIAFLGKSINVDKPSLSGCLLLVPRVTGGTATGPKVFGKFRPVGADWLVVRRDGMAALDVRATMETNDGALINVSYTDGTVTLTSVRQPETTSGYSVSVKQPADRMSPAARCRRPQSELRDKNSRSTGDGVDGSGNG
jgi:Protein of unknown function (DUF3237)